MRFVVTGGRGFIGSHFVDLLLSKNFEVVDFDVGTYAAHKILPFDNNSRYKWIKEDIATIEHLPPCDVVVNFAAESHVDNSITAPGKFVHSNILGVFNLLELIKNRPYVKPLFVQISTDEVYGDVREAGNKEEDTLVPSNPYSATKAAAEQLVQAYGRTYGIEYLITRSSNNYGPRQYEEKLIPCIISSLCRGVPFPMHGDGSYVRDWLYVKDNVQAIWSLIANNKRGVWNVAAQNHKSNFEVFEEICAWFGVEPEEGLNFKFVENRLGQDLRYSVDTTKIESEAHWKPKYGAGRLFNFLNPQ